MIDRDVVVISREWSKPEIKIQVNSNGIALAISLDDFVTALAAEVGSPTLLLTKAQLAAKMDFAKQVVLEKVKQESKQVM